MRIEQLFYLTEISRNHSLSLAAEALHISVQALSSSIKNLETELNTTILDRTNRGVSFTETGQLVLQYALSTTKGYNDLQQQLATTHASAASSPIQLCGTLYLHTIPVFLESILSSKINEFQQLYPEASIQIVQNTTHNICAAVQSEQHSALGMVLLPCMKNTVLRTFLPEGNMSFRPISISRFVCCVPKDSPFARHKTISIKKLLKEPLVIYTTGTVDNSPLLYLLRQYTEQLHITSSISSMTFWSKAIKDHIGIGFLNELFISSDSMVKDVFQDLVFIKVKEPLIAINGFIYADQLSPLASAFMDLFPSYRPSKNDPDFCTECMVL